MQEWAWKHIQQVILHQRRNGLLRGKKQEEISNTKSKGHKRRGNIRIVVSPVYVGSRPMNEVMENAVADRLKDIPLDKAG